MGIEIGGAAQNMDTVLHDAQLQGQQSLQTTLTQLRSSNELNSLTGQDRTEADTVLAHYEAQLTQYAGPSASALEKESRALTREAAHLTAQKTDTEEEIEALQTLCDLNSSIFFDKQATDGELADLAAGCNGAAMAKAATYLLHHPDVLNQVRGQDGGAVKWRMQELIAQLQPTVKALTEQITTLQEKAEDAKLNADEVRANAGTSPSGTTPTGTKNETTNTSSTPPPSGTDALLNAPLTLDMGSVKEGEPLDRATQRLTNAMTGLETRMDALVEQMGKETDPAKQKALEQKLNQLNRLMTSLSNMLQQLLTMQQNISKMYNDVAMGGIRHIV